MIHWNDDNGVLTDGKKFYKSGDEIPDGILSPDMQEELLKKGKIIITSAPFAPEENKIDSVPKEEPAAGGDQ